MSSNRHKTSQSNSCIKRGRRAASADDVARHRQRAHRIPADQHIGRRTGRSRESTEVEQRQQVVRRRRRQCMARMIDQRGDVPPVGWPSDHGPPRRSRPPSRTRRRVGSSRSGAGCAPHSRWRTRAPPAGAAARARHRGRRGTSPTSPHRSTTAPPGHRRPGTCARGSTRSRDPDPSCRYPSRPRSVRRVRRSPRPVRDRPAPGTARRTVPAGIRKSRGSSAAAPSP